MEEDLKNPVRLATGRWIKSRNVAFAWLHGASSPLKIRERLRAHAFFWDPASRQDLGRRSAEALPTEQEVEELACLMEATSMLQRERRRHQELQDEVRLRQTPEFKEAERKRFQTEVAIRRRIEERERLLITSALRCGAAEMWRKDRLVACEKLLEGGHLHQATSVAIAATLEAVARYATRRWGFQLRRTSSSSGRADSRYLVHNDGSRIRELRLSDHEIPIYGARLDRELEGQGPRWSEIIVTIHDIGLTPDEWRVKLSEAIGLEPDLESKFSHGPWDKS